MTSDRRIAGTARGQSRPRVIPAALLVAVALATVVGTAPATVAAPGDRERVKTQVVGGQPVPNGTYPFVVAMLDVRVAKLPHDQQFCGGSLIDASHVLTAAHCVAYRRPRKRGLRVAVGRTVLNSRQGTIRGVEKIWIHPDFSTAQGTAYDAAVLRLKRPVAGVAPIALASAEDAELEAPGAAVTIVGWGSTTRQPARGRARRPRFPDRMREAEARVVADDDCAAAYGGTSAGFAPALMVCAAAPGIDTCQGDSGGPLFAAGADGFRQIGIVSFGIGCADRAFPGVYTQVSAEAIADFVQQAMGGGPPD